MTNPTGDALKAAQAPEAGRVAFEARFPPAARKAGRLEWDKLDDEARAVWARVEREVVASYVATIAERLRDLISTEAAKTARVVAELQRTGE